MKSTASLFLIRVILIAVCLAGGYFAWQGYERLNAQVVKAKADAAAAQKDVATAESNLKVYRDRVTLICGTVDKAFTFVKAHPGSNYKDAENMLNPLSASSGQCAVLKLAVGTEATPNGKLAAVTASPISPAAPVVVKLAPKPASSVSASSSTAASTASDNF